jgi:hypothetical protein
MSCTAVGSAGMCSSLAAAEIRRARATSRIDRDTVTPAWRRSTLRYCCSALLASRPISSTSAMPLASEPVRKWAETTW